MSQYALLLPLAPIYAEGNFVVSGCNENAHRQIAAWPQWKGNALLLQGPAGSGKTHLAHIWAGKSHAGICDLSQGDALIPEAISESLLIESIDKLKDESTLLHALNYTKEQKIPLLLTSPLPPRELPFRLPDLRSRLLALPLASISSPDDTALEAAMRKQFSDRQVKVAPEVIAYLLARMERSFSGVQKLVGQLDAEALAEQRSLTIPFLKQVLG